MQEHERFSVKQVTKSQVEKLLVQSGMLARNAAFRTDANVPFATLNSAAAVLSQGKMAASHFIEAYNHSSMFFALLENVGTQEGIPITNVVGGYVDAGKHFPQQYLSEGMRRSSSKPLGNFENLLTMPSKPQADGFQWNDQRLCGLCGVTGTYSNYFDAKTNTYHGFDDKTKRKKASAAPASPAPPRKGRPPTSDFDTSYPLIIPLFCCLDGSAPAQSPWKIQSNPLGSARELLMFTVLRWAKKHKFEWVTLTAPETVIESCFYRDIGFHYLTGTKRHQAKDLGIPDDMVATNLSNPNNKRRFFVGTLVLNTKQWSPQGKLAPRDSNEECSSRTSVASHDAPPSPMPPAPTSPWLPRFKSPLRSASEPPRFPYSPAHAGGDGEKNFPQYFKDPLLPPYSSAHVGGDGEKNFPQRFKDPPLPPSEPPYSSAHAGEDGGKHWSPNEEPLWLPPLLAPSRKPPPQ